jgi:hypothetical protein
MSTRTPDSGYRKRRRPPPPGWVDRDGAGRLTGLAAKTLANLAVSGGGPPFAVLGGRAIYPLDRLERWLLAQLRVSTSDPGRDVQPRAPR